MANIVVTGKEIGSTIVTIKVDEDTNYLATDSKTCNVTVERSDTVDTSDGTATSPDILKDKVAYVKDKRVVGTMPIIPSQRIEIPINGSYTIPAGYHSGNGSVGNKTITNIASKTHTPTTTDIIIPGNSYLTGNQTISGSTYLKAANIKKGVTIWGITGEYTPTTGGDITSSEKKQFFYSTSSPLSLPHGETKTYTFTGGLNTFHIHGINIPSIDYFEMKSWDIIMGIYDPSSTNKYKTRALYKDSAFECRPIQQSTRSIEIEQLSDTSLEIGNWCGYDITIQLIYCYLYK